MERGCKMPSSGGNAHFSTITDDFSGYVQKGAH